jgi:hypothetical protein
VDVGERIQELADQIVVLRDAYYRGSPVVADAEYDAIEDELRTVIDANPELAPDPNPLEQVGAPAVLHAPIRHSRPMLSLEKATLSPWRREECGPIAHHCGGVAQRMAGTHQWRIPASGPSRSVSSTSGRSDLYAPAGHHAQRRPRPRHA